MNKTLKAIATLSILFFLGSCTENNYYYTSSTQESLDTALIGHWIADYSNTEKINMTFSGDQQFACFLSDPNDDNGLIIFRPMEYYTVGNVLHLVGKQTDNPDIFVGDYNISGNTMVTENFNYSALNGSWIKQ